MNEFVARLKQRKLVQWALVYVAAAFSLIQVVDVVAQRFGWPDRTEKLIILALALGFVVVLVLAWYHGEKGRQWVSGPELLLIALVLAVGGGLLWQFGRAGSSAVAGKVAMSPSAGTSPNTGVSRGRAKKIAAASSAGSVRATPAVPALPATSQPIPAKSIAVLPFENLSDDKNNAYFVSGMQDLILTKLADIGNLKVIARTATESYGSHPENLKQIAQQLGVATFLEGSVQKAGRQVLINVQLIDANTDAHIWADSYTRTLDNIFGVEGEVAQKVADALNAKLTAAETQAVARVPTRNPQAYEAFLRGIHFDNEADKGDFATFIPQAIAAFEKAVQEDPGFALAWAWLSNERTGAFFVGVDRSEANLKAASVAAKRALALDPKLPDAHLAMGRVERFLHHDIATARNQAQQAVNLRPNDVDALQELATEDANYGERGGHELMERAVALDPTSSDLEYQLGINGTFSGDYAAARQAVHRALAINPEIAPAYALLSRIDVLQSGDVTAATRVLDNMAPGTPSNNLMVANARIDLLLYRRNFAAARALAAKYAVEFGNGSEAPTIVMSQANIEWLAGDRDAARTFYRKAVRLLTSPGNASHAGGNMELGLAYARLGEAAPALRQNELFATTDRRSHAMGFEAQRKFALAKIQVALDENTAAIDTLAQVLASDEDSYDVSPALLRLDPTWDPIRRDPRFQALLKKHAGAIPSMASGAAAAGSG